MEQCTIETYPIETSFFRCSKETPFKINEKEPQVGDWSHSIYFFLEKKDIDKYRDFEHPYPMQFINNFPLNYIRCTYECFKGEYQKEDMDKIVKEIELLFKNNDISYLPKFPGVPFMQWLGCCGYAFQCYNNPEDDSEEIAIPFPLLKNPNAWNIINLE